MKILGRSMLKICIDANSRKNKVVILQQIENGEVKELARKDGDIDMTTSIGQLLSENNLKLKDIDDFTYLQGIGSFTGIKMAAAVANTLKWAVKRVPAASLDLPTYESEPNITPMRATSNSGKITP